MAEEYCVNKLKQHVNTLINTLKHLINTLKQHFNNESFRVFLKTPTQSLIKRQTWKEQCSVLLTLTKK